MAGRTASFSPILAEMVSCSLTPRSGTGSSIPMLRTGSWMNWPRELCATTTRGGRRSCNPARYFARLSHQSRAYRARIYPAIPSSISWTVRFFGLRPPKIDRRTSSEVNVPRRTSAGAEILSCGRSLDDADRILHITCAGAVSARYAPSPRSRSSCADPRDRPRSWWPRGECRRSNAAAPASRARNPPPWGGYTERGQCPTSGCPPPTKPFRYWPCIARPVRRRFRRWSWSGSRIRWCRKRRPTRLRQRRANTRFHARKWNRTI